MANKQNFSDQWIRSLKPDRKKEYFDTNVTGMILRVSKTGYKSFALRYWFDGTSKQYTIGKYGDWTLAEARKRARELKGQISDGIDPIKERKKARQQSAKQMLFHELSEIYDGIHLPTLRESSQNYHKWAMQVKVLPVIGKQVLKDITKPDVVRLLDTIAIKGGAQATANKVRSRLHHMFEFAKSRGYIESNPVADTKPYEGGYNESERFYSAEELRSIWEVIEKLNDPVRSYLKIIMLTGQRRTETHKMEWNHIRFEQDSDFEGWVWVIPKELAKSDREHIVPLSPFAQDIIDNLKTEAGNNPFVFASNSKPDIPIGLKTIKRAVQTIKKESTVPDFKLHDLRRTFATWLAKLGTSAEVVSKVLNHKTGGGGNVVTRIYNRYEYRKERQIALNKWGAELQRILTDTETKIHKLGS